MIDPNTNEIYHKIFNPPPENDKKLLERLKPIEISVEEISHDVKLTTEKAEPLFKWFRSEFGVED